jgi:hypothetical protein
MLYRAIFVCAVLAAAFCCGGCIQHKDIDFTERVIELVAVQTGEDVHDIESGTRLADLGFEEKDLVELVRRINESTSLKITVAELKALPAASPSWKRLRLHDIGSFVTSKVLDLREAKYPEIIRKGRLGGKK